MIYALDTNIISYWLQSNQIVEQRLSQALQSGAMFVIPPTAYYEIQRGFAHKTAPRKEKAFSLICNTYPVGEMDKSVWDEAANIYAASRRMGRSMSDSDILIAAFCIVNSYSLVTANTRHFEGIERLHMVDWTQ